MRTVLFLCTGNYFRSRFAELLFNQLAAEASLPVRAVSAGLAPDCFARNPGPISPHTRVALRARGIEVTDPRAPCDATEELFARANLIVAVKEVEHRPMMLARFPDWAGRVRYWNVDDIPLVQAADALASLEVLVRALVIELATPRAD